MRRVRRSVIKRRKRNQCGGALVSTVKRMLRRSPSLTDKLAYAARMLLSGPAPGFGTLGKLLGKQALKGIIDNVKHYKKGRRWKKIMSSSCLPRGVNVYATYIIEWCRGFVIASHVSSTKRMSRIKSLTNGFPKTWKMRCLSMSWNHTYIHYTTVSFIWWRLWDTMMGSIHIRRGIICIRSTFISIGSPTIVSNFGVIYHG